MSTCERFTAYCPCPRCGLVACHRLREPKPAPAGPVEPPHEVVAVYPWGIVRPVRTRHVRAGAVDESRFEVIRICECGHEWGQV